VVDGDPVVVVAMRESGPIRSSLDIVSRHDWPVGLTADGQARSDITAPVEVTTTVELRTGEPFVRIAVAFTNPARDHRVRWHLPLPVQAERSAAEGQFAVVERGLTEEAGHGEVPTPTFPAHGWVHAAGATVLLDHVTEYELVDDGRELALTLLRSTGLISRNDNPFREDPAGPEVPVPAAQMVGPWQARFAVLPHAGSWEDDGVLGAAEGYHLPFVTAPGTATASTESAGAFRAAGLVVAGPGVILTALRRRHGTLELRLVAMTASPTVAAISGRPFVEARTVDLLGRPGDELPLDADGSLRVGLGAWEIRTIHLRDGAG
jgi:mannosylglycerate hydrolase